MVEEIEDAEEEDRGGEGTQEEAPHPLEDNRGEELLHKVAEVVEALSGASDLPHRAVRFAMGMWSDGEVVSPFVLGRPEPELAQATLSAST